MSVAPAVHEGIVLANPCPTCGGFTRLEAAGRDVYLNERGEKIAELVSSFRSPCCGAVVTADQWAAACMPVSQLLVVPFLDTGPPGR